MQATIKACLLEAENTSGPLQCKFVLNLLGGGFTIKDLFKYQTSWMHFQCNLPDLYLAQMAVL